MAYRSACSRRNLRTVAVCWPRTGAPSLADVEILSAPDGVTLPRKFSMDRGQWLRTRLIVATCFGVDHNALEGQQNFGEELSARETKLEEYIP